MIVSTFPELLPAQPVDSILDQAARHNWLLRATPFSGVSAAGRIRRLTSDSVSLGRRSFAITSIERLERQTRSGGGMLTGGIVGGILGGIVGTAARGLCEGDCTSAYVALGAGSVVGGATLGLLLGEALVPSKRTWQAVWP